MKRIIKNKVCIVLAGTVLLLVSLSCQFGEGFFSTDGEETPSSKMLVHADTGGLITSLDGMLSLEIPPNALAEDTEISIAVIPPDELPESYLDWGAVGHAYRLEPDGQEFQEPIKVTLQIEGEQLSQIESEISYPSYMLISVISGGELEFLDNVDTQFSENQSTLVSGYTNHFSMITVINGYMTVEWIVLQNPQLIKSKQIIGVKVINNDSERVILQNPSIEYSCQGNISCEKELDKKSISLGSPANESVWFYNESICGSNPAEGEVVFRVRSIQEYVNKDLQIDNKKISLSAGQQIDCVEPSQMPPLESLTEIEEGALQVTWNTDSDTFNVNQSFNANLTVLNKGEPARLLSNINANFYGTGPISLDSEPFMRLNDISGGEQTGLTAIFRCGDTPGVGSVNVMLQALEGELEGTNPSLHTVGLSKSITCVLPPQEPPTQPPPTITPTVPPPSTGTDVDVDLKTSYVPGPAGTYTIYGKFTGPVGALVEAELTGAKVIGKRTRSGIISEEGYLQVQWDVSVLKDYRIEGTVGDEPVLVVIKIPKPTKTPEKK
ncbi:hypothetical protein ACFLUC_01665 [Chloroflexota bacterium]